MMEHNDFEAYKNRYKGLLKGVKFDNSRYRKAKISIAFAWLVGFLLIVPVVRRTKLAKDGSCGIDWNTVESPKMSYFLKKEDEALESRNFSEYSDYNESESQEALAYLYDIAGKDNYYEILLKNGSEDKLVELDQFHGRFKNSMSVVGPHLSQQAN